MIKEIPKGFCQCGCGEKAPICRNHHPARGYVKGEPRRFIMGHNTKLKPLKGSNHPNWNGGRTIHGKGYIMILSPNHPRANNKGYVMEAILIAEKALGKYLPLGAVVHHVNSTTNSGPLVVCQNKSYHTILHLRERALKVCGHANWRKCRICKKYDAPEKLHINEKWNNIYHRECRSQYMKRKRNERIGCSIP